MKYPPRVKLHHAAGKKTSDSGWNYELVRVRRIHGKMWAEATNGAIVARVPLEGEGDEGVFHKKVLEELCKGTIGENRELVIEQDQVKGTRGFLSMTGERSEESPPPIPETFGEQDCMGLTLDLEQLIRLGKALGTKQIELMVPKPTNERVQVDQMVMVRAVDTEDSGEYTGAYGGIMPMIWRRK